MLKRFLSATGAAGAVGYFVSTAAQCETVPDANRFGDSYMHVPFRNRADYSDHFMYKTLAGPKRFERYDFFTRVEGEPELRTVIHVGKEMCGHAGIVHGGATASIFDDCFGALVFSLKCVIPSSLPTHLVRTPFPFAELGSPSQLI